MLNRWWTSLSAQLRETCAIRPQQVLKSIICRLILACVCGLAAVCLGRPWLLCLVMGLMASGTFKLVRLGTMGRRGRQTLRSQLPIAFCCLSAALRGGCNSESAALVVAAGTSSTSKAAWSRVARRCHLGLDLAQAVLQMSLRCGLPEVELLAQRLRQGLALGGDLGAIAELAAVSAGAVQEITLRERAGNAAPAASLINALLIAPAAMLFIAIGVLGELAVSTWL